MADEPIWQPTTIDSWEDFARAAADMASIAAKRRTILFRGQPQQARLRTSLIRALSTSVNLEVATFVEENALNHFQSQAHLFQQHLEPVITRSSELFEWWARMQHHGAPTRLLDWTASPYVAAYFAAEHGPDSTGEIFVIDAGRVDESFGRRSKFDDRHAEGINETAFLHPRPTDEPRIVTFTPFHKTQRLVAQQGYFTVATHLLSPHDELLAATGGILKRWVFPASLEPNMLYHLRTMNVGANSLFPGIDGLGRSTAELIRIANGMMQ